ncbi:DUF3822 family protein [Robiginitalea sp. M366]|uniref:DUF3822 family protein n=1 Tax=Robiginitalea aestuariiviva TaxID=3036903 RepID=UPI00240E9920|nr:DUF3822 family protein [Robiginitalea aestuariiviva]MDG1572620.1 DUF3822 family protein [Robiginitalea aestuariiviva]
MTKKENNNKALSASDTPYHKLSIQVSLNGLSFCVLDTVEKNLSLRYAHRFEAPVTPYRLQHELKEHLREQGVWDYAFTEVVAIHRNTLFSLVPQAFFREEDLADYLKFNAKMLPTDRLDHDPVAGLDLMNVYVPFTNINNYLYDLFGPFEFKHSGTVLLETLVKLPSSGQGTVCYAHLGESQLDIAVFAHKKLRFFNSFSLHGDLDFLYYLLFTLEQLGLDPLRVKLRLLGEVTEGDPIFEQASEYLENVAIFIPGGPGYPVTDAEASPDFTLIGAL